MESLCRRRAARLLGWTVLLAADFVLMVFCDAGSWLFAHLGLIAIALMGLVLLTLRDWLAAHDSLTAVRARKDDGR